jgi:hypothetical protein
MANSNRDLLWQALSPSFRRAFAAAWEIQDPFRQHRPSYALPPQGYWPEIALRTLTLLDTPEAELKAEIECQRAILYPKSLSPTTRAQNTATLLANLNLELKL